MHISERIYISMVIFSPPECRVRPIWDIGGVAFYRQQQRQQRQTAGEEQPEAGKRIKEK